MKYLLTLISLMVLTSAHAFEELHEFAMNDGSAFDAVVITCDSENDTVELLTPEGSLVSSCFSVFTPETRGFLKQWEMRDLFMSSTRFVVIPSHSVDREWVGDPDAEQDEFALLSGVSVHQYYLTLYNLGGIALENLSVDYHIVYSQSCSAFDAFSLRSDSVPGEKGSVSVSQAVDGSIPVSSLVAGGWKMFSTHPIPLADQGDTLSSSEIFITISMETPDGNTLSRQIELPKFEPAQPSTGGA